MHTDTPKMKFLEVSDFVQDLQRELENGFSSLKITCFKFTYQSIFKKIYPSILHNLKSGAKVTIEIDAYFSKYNLTRGSFYRINFGKSQEKEKLASETSDKVFQNLRDLGAKITYVNKQNWIGKNLFPFAGRDHRKLIFIERSGSKIAYFGAANLDDGEKNDYMVKIYDHDICEELYKVNTLDFLDTQKDDISLFMNKNLSFFVDLGTNLRSNIQDVAFEMISRAKGAIRYVNQLPPEPHILFQLIKARLRGVKVEIVLPEFTHRLVTGFPFIFPFSIAYLASKIFNFDIFPCKLGFTHAKILVCDNQLLLGSHNLSLVGVIAGTREISMLVNDSALWIDANNFIDHLIGKQYHSQIYKLEPQFLEVIKNKESKL